MANLNDLEELANRLKVTALKEEAGLAEKMQASSYLWTDDKDRVRITVKKDFNLDNPELIKFLRESYDSF